MFHVILQTILLFSISALPIYFNHNSTSIEISSSLVANQIQMIMEIKASIGTQIKISTKALSHEHEAHIFKMEKQKILVAPEMDHEAIEFNYQFDGLYSIALSHEIKDETIHFLPIQMESNGKKVQFLLPAFNMRMYHIQTYSIFRCHNTLIAVNVDEKDDKVYLNFFSEDRKQGIWHLKDKWQHDWRSGHRQAYFGGAHKKGINSNIKIYFSDGKYCQFTWQNTPKEQIKLNTKDYYTIRKLLGEVPALQLKQQTISEQL